jgi:hypothetical protein
MSALNRGGVEEIQFTGKAPPPDHRAHRPGKTARSRWLRRGAYVVAVAALLAFWWTHQDAERTVHKLKAPPVAPSVKGEVAEVSEAVTAEPPAAPSSPPADSTGRDARPAQ